MANPNKIYHLPCELDTFFDDIGHSIIVRETIKLGKRQFQINGYIIEVE